jgi:hypothetical protein
MTMVTWFQLGMIGATLIGIALLALGVLSLFGGMMSDNPAAGEESSSWGCGLVIAGLVVAIIAIALAVRHAI